MSSNRSCCDGNVCADIDPPNPVLAPTFPATGTLTWRWDGVMEHIGWAARCFDLMLTFAPEPIAIVGGPPPAADSNLPTLLTALQEQLGLKLESQRAPLDMVIIDSIEPPTPD